MEVNLFGRSDQPEKGAQKWSLWVLKDELDGLEVQFRCN